MRFIPLRPTALPTLATVAVSGCTGSLARMLAEPDAGVFHSSGLSVTGFPSHPPRSGPKCSSRTTSDPASSTRVTGP